MKSKTRQNYLYNLSYQLLTLLLPLVTIPYVSRVLGPENLGIYSFTLSITTYFITLGSLGIALYGQREVAYHQHDPAAYTKTFFEIFLLRLCTLTAALALFYLIFVLGNLGDYGLYYLILSLEIIGGIFDISWFLQGLEDFKHTVLRNTVVKLLSVAAIFLLVKSPADLWLYTLIYALSVLLGNLSLWLYLPRYLTKINFKTLNTIKHLKPTFALFIPQIAIQIYTLLDKTMIGIIITDKSEVGYYDQSQKIVKLLLTIITSLGTVMMPRIANHFAKGNHEKIKAHLSKSFKLVFALALPMIAGILLFSDAFVPLFFGPGYEKVAVLMKVSSPILLLIGISNVTGVQFLLPTKRQKAFTISVVCGALVNFTANLLLIPILESLGATIGTLIAEATVTGIQLYYVRSDFSLKEMLKPKRKGKLHA